MEKLAKLALFIPNSCHPAPFGLWEQMSRPVALTGILIVMILSTRTLNHAEELAEVEFCNQVDDTSGPGIYFVTVCDTHQLKQCIFV